MCLDTKLRTVLLKKDLKVKKIVKIGLNNNLYTGTLLGKHSRILKGINTAKECTLPVGKSTTKYDSGFHCYLSKYTEHRILNSWCLFHDRIVINLIIPKGTKVIYGKQHGMTVIVTPVFIYNGKGE